MGSTADKGHDSQLILHARRAFLVLLIVLAACTRPSEVYEIPGGYTGWVEIRYTAQCKDKLPTRFYTRTIQVPTSGRMCVNSAFNEGMGRDRFYYVYPDGRRVELHEETPRTGMIWNRSTRQIDLGKDLTDRFFVGSQRELQARGDDETFRPPQTRGPEKGEK